MPDERIKQHVEEEYAKLEKSFVSYADLTTVTELDITADAEPFITLPAYGEGLIGKYVVRYDIESLQNQNIIVRESVYKKLLLVDAALKRRNGNWQLVVVYGYRSFDIQQQLFNNELEKVRTENPGINENEITEIVHRRVAVPSVAGHPTGGTVDVTIYDFANDCYLDFGTEVRDFSTKDVYFKSKFISKQQADNRSLLRTVMTAENFAPYDGEWWHFSYGDKEWAFYYQRQALRSKSDKSTKNLKYLYAHKPPFALVYADKYRDSATVEQVGSIRLAMQKKGRLTDETIHILTKAGIDVAYDEGRFFGKCNNFPLELLFVRDDDIPDLIDAGIADIGIVGKNIYEEYDCQSLIIKELGFGRCALAIAVPETSQIKSIFDLSGKKVATSYRRSVEKFFKKENITGIQIVSLSGSVEMAPTLGYADAIVDIVSTGSSLRQNKLKFLHKIFDSESVLIVNKNSNDNQDKRATIDRLVNRISGYLSAKNFKHITFSISTKRLASIRAVLSSANLICSSDAYTFDDDKLSNNKYSIVRAVVRKSSVWDVVEKLREIGAKDIVFNDIESMM